MSTEKAIEFCRGVVAVTLYGDGKELELHRSSTWSSGDREFRGQQGVPGTGEFRGQYIDLSHPIAPRIWSLEPLRILSPELHCPRNCIYRHTSKVSRQVLRFFKLCFLKQASPALYQRELRPMLMAYL